VTFGHLVVLKIKGKFKDRYEVLVSTKQCSADCQFCIGQVSIITGWPCILKLLKLTQ